MFTTLVGPRVAVTVVFVSCLGLLFIGAAARKTGLFTISGQAIQPQVTNRTVSARVLEVRRVPNGDVEVVFINQSLKPIYAYTFITSDKPTKRGVTVFATVSPVAPGETRSERIPAANLASPNDPSRRSEIVFSALYLAGGAIEGDAPDAEKLHRTMKGIKEQASATIQILREELRQGQPLNLEMLETRIKAATAKGTPTSRDGEEGRAMVNEKLTRTVTKLRTANATDGDAKSRLKELVSYFERLSEEL